MGGATCLRLPKVLGSGTRDLRFHRPVGHLGSSRLDHGEHEDDLTGGCSPRSGVSVWCGTVGRHSLAKTRQRSSLAVAAGVVSAATLFVVGADAHPHINNDAACCAVVAASNPPSPPPVPVHPIGPEPDRPALPRTLPRGVAQEKGLQVDTILAARAVSAAFPEILDIGGVRSDPLKWHPHGLAIDVMIPNARSAAGIALGDSVLAYVLKNAERFDLNHVIWRQTIYYPNRPQRKMSDRGSDTANHYDHVHIATDGGGYPREDQTYLR